MSLQKISHDCGTCIKFLEILFWIVALSDSVNVWLLLLYVILVALNLAVCSITHTNA